MRPYHSSQTLSFSNQGLDLSLDLILKLESDCAFEVRSSDSIICFKHILKTHFYGLAFPLTQSYSFQPFACVCLCILE